MGLFDAFKGIIKAIPVVGDVLKAVDGTPAGAGGDMGYINGTDPSGLGGFLKKTGKSFVEALEERDEKRPTTEVGSPTLGANIGSLKMRPEQIPGYQNPKFKSLYDQYDLNKIMRRNLITSRAEIRRVSAGEPDGPNIKLTRGMKYADE